MRKIVKNTSSGQRAQQLINPIDDKKGFEGSYRVRRGGGWGGYPDRVRASRRGYSNPTRRYDSIGFRLVRNA